MSEEFYSEIEFPFTMIPNSVWEIGLTGNEMIVLNRILFRAGLKGQCFESRASIAEACCMTERTVGTVFAELESLNIVQIKRRRAENKPNLIRIKKLADWVSKRKKTSSEDGPQENISQGLRKKFPEAQENISYGTRSPEQDKRELYSDSFAPTEVAAPEPVVPEVLFDEKKSKQEKTPAAQIFDAYAQAYEQRYKIPPLRNAKVNGVCAMIAKQLPLEEAKAIMHFYLRQNVSWYVQKSHAIEYALKDLQALRTNMLKNTIMSSTAANQLDKMSANLSALQESCNGENQSSFDFGSDVRQPFDHKATFGVLRKQIEKPK